MFLLENNVLVLVLVLATSVLKTSLLFVLMETGRNTLRGDNKIYYFTLTVSPYYLVKLKTTTSYFDIFDFMILSLQFVRSNRLSQLSQKVGQY